MVDWIIVDDMMMRRGDEQVGLDHRWARNREVGTRRTNQHLLSCHSFPTYPSLLSHRWV
jgi:hypothetical protein